MLPKDCFVLVTGPFNAPRYLFIEGGIVAFTSSKDAAIKLGCRASAEALAEICESADVRIEELWLTDYKASSEPVEWWYHGESESIFSAPAGQVASNVGGEPVDPISVPVALRKVAMGGDISAKDLALLMADRDRMLSTGEFQQAVIELGW